MVAVWCYNMLWSRTYHRGTLWSAQVQFHSENCRSLFYKTLLPCFSKRFISWKSLQGILLGSVRRMVSIQIQQNSPAVAQPIVLTRCLRAKLSSMAKGARLEEAVWLHASNKDSESIKLLLPAFVLWRSEKVYILGFLLHLIFTSIIPINSDVISCTQIPSL